VYVGGWFFLWRFFSQRAFFSHNNSKQTHRNKKSKRTNKPSKKKISCDYSSTTTL
jgi:hypothetical protein